MVEPFRAYDLASETPVFEELLASARFAAVAKGRRGNVLVAPDDDGSVPIVRTTTTYSDPAERFRPIHDRLAERIRRVASIGARFDNALIEHYTRTYRTMKCHSDQALDLAEGSVIAVYSCYRDPRRPSRRLLVTPKEPGGAPLDILLSHDGVVVFSVETNRCYRHTIALAGGAPDGDWLGITFRTSKTRVQFGDRGPTFVDGMPLTLATEEERRDFLQMRRRENDEVDFTYPRIAYTLSPSDLLPPWRGSGDSPMLRRA